MCAAQLHDESPELSLAGLECGIRKSMRRTLGAVLALFSLLALPGCGSKFDTSGVSEVDQTAKYVKNVIDTIREEDRFENPSQIATYITSAEGRMEFMPPNPETDPDGAAAFDGPRPHKDVAVWARPFSIGRFKYYMLVAGDDENGQIVVSAFKVPETAPFHIWRF